MRDGSVDGEAPRDLGGEDGATPRDGGARADGGDVCGDAVLGITESCEDGNLSAGDGCSASCAVEPGFRCPSVVGACRAIVCGDRLVETPERCDDGNARAGDGCDASCVVEPGWECIVAGVACQAAACGDGLVAGFEVCDDGDTMAGDGCAADCRLEAGFTCPTPGMACRATVCGDSVAEGSEQCDDGNPLIGDGCTPLCTREPDCRDGSCAPVCGDGQLFPGEMCDDGNTASDDGCSSACVEEAGHTCTLITTEPPTTLTLPVVYRDFRASHSDFEEGSCSATGLVQPMWNAARKPVRAAPTRCFMTNFAEWYTESPASITIPDVLVLTRAGVAPSFTYEFDDTSFFPLTGRGWSTMGEPERADGGGTLRNFHFTSELRFWFRYDAAAPPATLSFRGDDDVYVFINGTLAVDIGGVHGPETGAVTVGPATAATFGLIDGGIYEAAVFQAERQTTGSNYRLTLQNFFAGRSSCVSNCGDGVVTRTELCDDGTALNTGGYGRCGADCRSRGPTCGDGIVQSAEEQCDLGLADNDGRYGGCNPDCTNGPRCGDAVRQGPEECDAGEMNGPTASCSLECRLNLF